MILGDVDGANFHCKGWTRSSFLCPNPRMHMELALGRWLAIQSEQQQTIQLSAYATVCKLLCSWVLSGGVERGRVGRIACRTWRPERISPMMKTGHDAGSRSIAPSYSAVVIFLQMYATWRKYKYFTPSGRTFTVRRCCAMYTHQSIFVTRKL
jgi:hypothetical protein